MIYRFLRFLFSQAVRIYFRGIEVENLDRIPASGPVLLLPNHPNGMVDPFLVLIFLKRPLSLTAKSTLTKNPFIAFLFQVGKVVPIHRRQDQALGADPTKNQASLEEVRRRLASGGAVLMFPEGISHNEPQLQPLKTGAARIALEYVDHDGNPGGLKIVPVGIDYTEKQSFRSSALVRMGEPIDAGAWRAAHPGADPHALMDEVDRRLRELTLNFEKRKHSIILSHAARLFLTQGMEPSSVGDVKEDGKALIGAMEGLQERYEALMAEGRHEEVAALGARIRAFATRLKQFGLHPRELWLDLSPLKAAWFLLREFLVLGAGLPFALFGMLHHAPPYFFSLLVTRLFSKTRDNWATMAIFSAVFAFPLWYAAFLSFLWTNTELEWVLLYAALLPFTLWAAIRFRDRIGVVFKRSAAFTLFVIRPGLRKALRAEGRDLIEKMKSLGALA